MKNTNSVEGGGCSFFLSLKGQKLKRLEPKIQGIYSELEEIKLKPKKTLRQAWPACPVERKGHFCAKSSWKRMKGSKICRLVVSLHGYKWWPVRNDGRKAVKNVCNMKCKCAGAEVPVCSQGSVGMGCSILLGRDLGLWRELCPRAAHWHTAVYL